MTGRHRKGSREGGETLDGPNDVPTGRNLTVRHPGGAIVEYVEIDAAKLQALPGQ
ncbi:hypothetical protein AB0K67_36690 [Nonomuraea sp. NPDC052634]|uniref:hypothetical protein n=1 Tax=Nonomuraea sp. NPDC052634 TaxID=3155813 RepID=UPI00344301E8